MNNEERIYYYLKNNGGKKKGYFGKGNKRLYEDYDDLIIYDYKENGDKKDINKINDYKIDNIVNKKNKDIISKVSNDKFMKGNYFINIKDKDDKDGELMIEKEIKNGVYDEVGLRE